MGVSRRPRNDPSGAMEQWGAGLVLRVLHCPRKYPSGEKECDRRGWLRLWGVAGAPSVGCSPMVTLRCPPNELSGPTESRWTGTFLPPLE